MMSLGYIFNEGKAAEAAAYLLSLNDGRLPYLKLIKLLYISDRRALTMYHASITTSSYYSMKFGPVTSEILDRIKHPEDFPEDGYWNSAMDKDGYDICLKTEFKPYFLSEAEREILAAVDSDCKDMEKFEIADFTHSFAEWRDPGDSRCPLSIEDILQATISDDAERQEAINDIRLSAHLQSLGHWRR